MFRFVEHPENNEKHNLDQKAKVKFKIMSLKVKAGIEYAPELVRSYSCLCLKYYELLTNRRCYLLLLE